MLLTATLAAGSWVAVTATPAAAAPFDPQVPMVYLSQGSPTQLQGSEQNGGRVVFSNIGGPADPSYNAIGYRVSDSYVYGISRPVGLNPAAQQHRIVRINADGSVDDRGGIPEQPSGLIAGTFGEGALANTLLVMTVENDTLYRVNVDAGTFTTQALSGADTSFSDMTAAYGYLWGVNQNGGSIARVDPATGVKTSYPVAGMLTDSGAYGGAWTYGNGNLAFSNNGTGTITQIRVTNPASPVFNLVSAIPGPQSGNNDATAAPGDPTDLSVTKNGPATVAANGTITWTVRVRNLGPGTSSGFVLNDTVPTGVTAITAADPRCTVTGRNIACVGDNLLASSNVLFTFTGTAPNAAATLVNTATVVPNEVDTDPTNNTDDATTVVQVAPPLVPHSAITKTSNAQVDVQVGDVVTYTVTVRNDGTAPYTAGAPATMSDSLADVFDDATWNANPTVTFSGGSTSAPPVLSGSTLNWSGPLAVGETATIRYSVTVTGAGNDQLLNTACAPSPGQTPACITVTDLVPNLVVSKSVNPASGTTVLGNQVLTYTLTFSNTGGSPATVNSVDHLAGVLDDATVTAAPTASAGLTVSSITGGTFTVQGSVAANSSATVSYQVTVIPDATRTGDDSVVNWVLPAGVPVPADCTPGICTINPVPSIADSKTVNPLSGSTVRPGQVLTYTLIFTNNGDGPGTVAKDDALTRLLDDADITSGPTVQNGALTAVRVGDRIRIDGTLQAGQTEIVSYQATVRADGARGDDVLSNFLVPRDSTIPDTCVEDCSVNFAPEIVTSKSVNPTSGSTVLANQVLTYTLTFSNNGAAPDTIAHDDVLADVLDDAQLNGGPTVSNAALTATIAADRLLIDGTLQPGQTVTVTYSVTVRADGARGDDVIGNFLVPRGTTVPDDCVGPNCSVNFVPEIVDSKTVDPASGSTVLPQQVLTYTLTFSNSGSATGPVARDDALAGVLDDADLTSGPTVSNPALAVTRVGDRWRITGNLQPGQTVTVSYTVTVRADGTRGDDVIENYLIPIGSTIPDDCTGGDCAVNRVPEIVDSKSADPASGGVVLPQQVITYTLTFGNTGAAEGTVAKDDVLAGVLDDADLTSGPTVSNAALTATRVGDRIRVTGILQPGQTVTVTYQVTVRADGARGDDRLVNAIVPPDFPPPPACAPGDCVEHFIPHVVDTKTSDPGTDSVVAVGQVISYTLTFSNLGTAVGPVAKDDVLTDVLDDAGITTPIAVSNPALTAVLTGDRIRVTGTLQPDQTITVTYAVTVRADGERGNDLIANALVLPGELGGCTDPLDCTVQRMPHLVDSKSVDPATGTGVSTGSVVTYTLTFGNIGTAAGTVLKDDVLTGVLDDATLTTPPTASNGALTATVNGDRIRITGALDPDQTVTVTYAVTVNDDEVRGDNVLRNFLLPPDTTVPDECVGPDCTENPVSQILDSKTSDPADGATVLENQVVTYTLTFSNTGEAEGPVARTDSLVAVLDDADITSGPTVSDAALTAVLDGTSLVVTGDLQPDQTVTVTYAATVRPDGERGDNTLVNHLLKPGEIPGDECVEGDDDCTVQRVPLITSAKSVDPASGTSVVTGTTLAYTLTFGNEGAATGPVAYTDRLADVLDDADLIEDSLVTSDPTLTATVVDDTIAVTGQVAVGQLVTVTYEAVVRPFAERGDSRIGNFLLKNGDEPSEECTDADDCTVNLIPHLSVLKTSDATPLAEVGDTITYVVTVINDGTADFTEESPAAVADDLSSVLDDADYNGDVVGERSDGTPVEVDYTAPVMSWTGPLEVGETVELTYSVTTRLGGDLEVENGACVPNGGEDPTCVAVTTGLADIGIIKTVDPTSGTSLRPGATATYTLTIANSGTGAGAYAYTDWLAGVLDDATLSAGPTATGGAIVSPVREQSFDVSGILEAGAKVVVTYSVQTRAYADQGDHRLGNWVTAAGERPDGTCAPGALTCTVNPLLDRLAATGATVSAAVGGLAGFLLLAGLVLVVIRRARSGSRAV
ncbi:putative repeat protein (TIGR01451 family) [Diaminobutyricimonas aerilata]|uniref:Putative repeat protein (TIGR01451 family) n=2 Tax=Diaminobutyricimonas aerilata TaxID=1162967 RepID=A0A2M9CHG7_9MICO|nr:putative repeat protein (TIGR01451 family) [Diaminobutyricimonas aerilata]